MTTQLVAPQAGTPLFHRSLGIFSSGSDRRHTKDASVVKIAIQRCSTEIIDGSKDDHWLEFRFAVLGVNFDIRVNLRIDFGSRELSLRGSRTPLQMYLRTLHACTVFLAPHNKSSPLTFEIACNRCGQILQEVGAAKCRAKSGGSRRHWHLAGVLPEYGGSCLRRKKCSK